MEFSQFPVNTVKVNEGDQTPICYKHGTSIDFSSFGVTGNKSIGNAGPRKCSVLQKN